MFQSTDSSNDEIYGFDGESNANGKNSINFQQIIDWSICVNFILTKHYVACWLHCLGLSYHLSYLRLISEHFYKLYEACSLLAILLKFVFSSFDVKFRQ